MKYCSRYQFVLTNSKNDIICKRYFQIKGYNDNVFKNIITIKRMVDSCSDLIKKDLKIKSREHHYNHKRVPHNTCKIKLIDNNINIFFKILVDEKVRVINLIPVGIYPPKIRYHINIKHLVPSIIAEVQHVLSNKTILLP